MMDAPHLCISMFLLGCDITFYALLMRSQRKNYCTNYCADYYYFFFMHQIIKPDLCNNHYWMLPVSF